MKSRSINNLAKISGDVITDIELHTGYLVQQLSPNLIIFHDNRAVIWQLQKQKNILILVNGTQKFYDESNYDGLTQLVKKIVRQ